MNRPARALAAIVVFVVGIVGIAAAVFYLATDPQDSSTLTTQPATTTTAPGSQAVVQAPPRTYGEVLKAAYPQLATTQPMGVPLNLYTEAAHFILSDPVYVCSRLDLWLTRPDAEPAEAVLDNAIDEQTHLVRDHVAFVHWAPDDRGKWRPRIVAQRDDGGYELISPAGRIPVTGEHRYLWHRALSWGNAIVVPTQGGISVLTPGGTIEELHHAFALPMSPSTAPSTGPATAEFSSEPLAEPQVTFDSKGIIAWMPWDDGKRGSSGAVRFAEGRFSPLGPAQGWPEKLVQVVPLLDGSVLQIVRDDSGRILPKLELLNQGNIDERAVTALVEQLSDADPEKRQQAYNQLTRYGPLVWPLLEKLSQEQPPEAAIRLQQLLANKTQPTMGGLTLVDGEMVTASRLPDGGVVFFAPAGVSFARENAEPAIVSPAWISIRPGKPVQLLPDRLLAGAAPPEQQIYAFGEEWVLTDDEHGPQHLMFNHAPRLLRDEEKPFSQLYAIDRRGRWLFRKPAGAEPSRQTLIIDPTFPDPTPRLPIWVMEIHQGSTGWDENDWPCIKSGGAWALHEKGWRPVDESKQRMFNELPQTQTPSQMALLSEPLLTDADGNRYYDGATMLHVVSKDNKHTVWPLPLSARGLPGGTLLRYEDGRLFLFNSPGRVCRIKPTPGADEPFTLEATFTERVPAANIARIWTDRANRICVAYDGNKLAILFPQGHIPPHIATMIPASELR
ncbi:MAG TPA: hypothetical protein VGR35_04275 [Tepidisphaeraceae bacterium]|nr:hypothetical protein [Tepidisphaeraceae bacterium]